MDKDTVARIAAANAYTLPTGRAEALSVQTEKALATLDRISRRLPFEAEPGDFGGAIDQASKQ